MEKRFHLLLRRSPETEEEKVAGKAGREIFRNSTMGEE